MVGADCQPVQPVQRRYPLAAGGGSGTHLHREPVLSAAGQLAMLVRGQLVEVAAAPQPAGLQTLLQHGVTAETAEQTLIGHRLSHLFTHVRRREALHA